MSPAYTPAVGHRVTFLTTGRGRHSRTGKIVRLFQTNGAWAEVECDDGVTRRTRFSTLKPAV